MKWEGHVAQKWGRREMYAKFWYKNRKERDRLELVVKDERVWTGFIWLRIGTSGRLL
jgi:hypothetical protein